MFLFIVCALCIFIMYCIYKYTRMQYIIGKYLHVYTYIINKYI